MATKDRTMGSLAIARTVSGPYRAHRGRRSSTLTNTGMLLFAALVLAMVAAVAIGCA